MEKEYKRERDGENMNSAWRRECVLCVSHTVRASEISPFSRNASFRLDAAAAATLCSEHAVCNLHQLHVACASACTSESLAYSAMVSVYVWVHARFSSEAVFRNLPTFYYLAQLLPFTTSPA